ncbi:MAG: ABC transporter ATP-binding protein, partial [Chloroflexaceae bacterium]|nr:ABC transporter ATP-binding protein [Chloroflexaceae bacterium]
MTTEHTSDTAHRPTAANRSWRERWADARAALRNIPRSLALVWQAHRIGTVGLLLLTLLAAGLPASQAWVSKLLVDTIVQAISSGLQASESVPLLLPLLLVGFGLFTLATVLNQSYTLLEHVLNARLSHCINEMIIEKALALDLHYFENAEFYDRLQKARREADARALSILNTLFALLQGMVTLASFGFVLVAISPWVALILFGATLPSFLAQAHYGGLYFRLLNARAPEFRKMHYLEYLLTVDQSVKEMKLFQLGLPLLKRYQAMFWQFYHEDAALARRRSLISVGWGMLTTASFYAAYAWIALQAIDGAITLGDLTLYLVVFQQSQTTFRSMLSGAARLYESGLFMDNLFEYLKLEPQMPVHQQPRDVPNPLQQGIEFRNVSFRYPGRSEWTLRSINLSIAPGEKLALVGANGAGKTTLIKLLTRLYDPDEGTILLDGHDVRAYDLDQVRQCIGVIFQDFVRYQATARENIGFGQVDALDQQERIELAAQRSGADAVVATFQTGYATMLGRWFAEGYELSGGEWQKIALGRAFMRDSQVLVLDEPTAALDAAHEFELFQRFRHLTEGKIALLISHRFSTVRMADRIAVLVDGQIAEIGSHQELLALQGHYKRLFAMQAQGVSVSAYQSKRWPA